MMSKNMLFFLLLTILKESASQGLEEAKSKSMPFPNDRIPSCKKVNYSEGRLYDMIMNKNQYRLRPRLNQSETVDIEVVLTLTAISEFHEREGKLVLSGFIGLLWRDDYLRWDNMAPFNCTRHIVTDSLLLWQPTIIWQSGYMISENSDANRATIFSDGYVSLYHTGEITTICFSDLAMFPFDTQRCKIVLEIHSLRSEALKLHPLQPIAFYKTQGIMWVEHKIWEVLDNKTDIVEIPANYHYGELWEERRQLIIFTMLIRRRPMYYFVNIIIPCLVIAAVEIVVFLVRITSFEKTNVSIMCLLAYTMVEVQIMKEAPKGSAEIPLLSIYIVLQMAYIGLLAITAENIVLVIVKRSRRKDQIPPSPSTYQFFKHFGSIILFDGHKLCKSSPKKSKNTSSIRNLNGKEFVLEVLNKSKKDTVAKQIDEEIEKQIENLDNDIEEVDEEEQKQEEEGEEGEDEHPQLDGEMTPKQQWLHIAECIERFNLILYITMTFLTPIVMFAGFSPQKRLDH